MTDLNSVLSSWDTDTTSTSTTTSNTVTFPSSTVTTTTGSFTPSVTSTITYAPSIVGVWNPPVPEEVTPDEMNNYVSLYKGKMIKRMERFLNESRRMDTKIKMIFDKAAELGYKIETIKIWKNDNPRRRKTPPLCFHIEAKRGEMLLKGTMTIKPATIHFNLNRETKYWDRMSVLSIKFFRTLCVKDNYLAVLVKAEPQSVEVRF